MAGKERSTREDDIGTAGPRKLRVLPGRIAVARLEPGAPSPSWLEGVGFACAFRTHDSLTVVCSQSLIPAGVASDPDWRCLMVEGPLALSLTGVLACLTAPLAQAGIPIFAMSSYETDFILVKEERLSAARHVLQEAGYNFAED